MHALIFLSTVQKILTTTLFSFIDKFKALINNFLYLRCSKSIFDLKLVSRVLVTKKSSV